MPKPPSVSSDLSARELALAEDAAHSYEHSGREILNVLDQIAKHILVKDFDSFVDRSPSEINKLTDALTDQVEKLN